MASPREKFQELLKKLFQFDCAELDFGIYRIMNQKRAVIEQFIETDLLEGVAKELGSGAIKDEAELRQQFDAVAEKIREDFDDEDAGTSALDAEGNLPETFNYLLGLHVASHRVFEDKGERYLVYRGKADGRETVILWRTTRGWKQEQFEADRDFVARQKLTGGAEDIFVNTDSFIEGARSLDPVFKKKMFNED